MLCHDFYGASRPLGLRLRAPRASLTLGASALAASRCGGLELPSLAGLHVVALPAEILQDAGLGDLSLEGLEGSFEAVVLTNRYFDHSLHAFVDAP